MSYSWRWNHAGSLQPRVREMRLWTSILVQLTMVNQLWIALFSRVLDHHNGQVVCCGREEGRQEPVGSGVPRRLAIMRCYIGTPGACTFARSTTFRFDLFSCIITRVDPFTFLVDYYFRVAISRCASAGLSQRAP